MDKLSDLKGTIASRFRFLNDYTDGEFEIDGYDASVFRLEGEIGVMFDTDNPQEMDESFNAICIRTSMFSMDGDNPSRKLVLSTKRNEQDFLDKFAIVCAEFIDNDENGIKRSRIIADPFSWYESWADVMGTKSGRRNPTSVIGELVALDYLIINGQEPVWMGSGKNSMDMRTRDFDYKIRSATSTESKTLRVSLNGLRPEGDRRLRLLQCSLRESEDGVSVDDMVKKLVEHGVTEDELEEEMTSFGYDKGKIARYYRYEVTGIRLYDVDDEFPCITEESFIGGAIPKGISSLEYTVSLEDVSFTELTYEIKSEEKDVFDKFMAPKGWVENKVRKGSKTFEDLLSYASNDDFFEMFIEDYGWPEDTQSEWTRLVEEVRTEIVVGSRGCWESVSESIASRGIDQGILDSDCSIIFDDIQSRYPADRCIREMVLSPQCIDTVDVLSGLVAKSADAGWNMFVIITDNYRIGAKQVVNRLCDNLKDSGNAFTWHMLHAYSMDTTETDPSLLQLNMFNNSRYLITCMRNSSNLNRIQNWLNECGDRRSDMKLMILDHRSDMHMNVISRGYKDHFVVDDFVDRITGYTEEHGDGDNDLGGLSYVSFVPSPFHIFTNRFHNVVNPLDSFHVMEPLKPYMGMQQLFPAGDVSPKIIEGDTELSTMTLRMGLSTEIPDSLKDALAWFICATAIASEEVPQKMPCMLVMLEQSWEHASSFASALETFIRNRKGELIESCRNVYEMIVERNQGVHASVAYPGSDETFTYPCYDDIVTRIREIVMNDGYLDVHLDDGNSINTEYDILNKPTIVVNNGSYIRLTEASCVLSIYFTRRFNAGDTAMRPSPWFGHHEGYKHLIHVWMSDRIRNYYTDLAEVEREIAVKASGNLRLSMRLANEPKVVEFMNGRHLKGDGRVLSREEVICSVCGSAIPPATPYHIRQDNKAVRCTACQEHCANATMGKRFNYLSEDTRKVLKIILDKGEITRDEVDGITGSAVKSRNILDLLKMEGYRTTIDRTGTHRLIWIPQVRGFIDLLEGGCDPESLVSSYEDCWKWIYGYYRGINGNLPELPSEQDPSSSGMYVTHLLNMLSPEERRKEPTGYEDVSDNDDVYFSACARIRNKVFGDLMRECLSNCDGVTVTDDGIVLNEVEHTYSCYLSGDDIPDGEDSDLIIVIEDDVIVITMDDVVPFKNCFDCNPEAESILDYVVELRRSGF